MLDRPIRPMLSALDLARRARVRECKGVDGRGNVIPTNTDTRAIERSASRDAPLHARQIVHLGELLGIQAARQAYAAQAAARARDRVRRPCGRARG